MDKKFADETIIKFQRTFFGFALARTNSIQEAEELASRITLEAYAALLKSGNIYNWNGYLYKIACNVYAKYVNGQSSHRALNIDKVQMNRLQEQFNSRVYKKMFNPLLTLIVLMAPIPTLYTTYIGNKLRFKLIRDNSKLVREFNYYQYLMLGPAAKEIKSLGLHDFFYGKWNGNI